MKITTNQGERFWGGQIDLGTQMPYQPGAAHDLHNTCDNQVNYLLLSNQGRVIWSEKPFAFTVCEDCIEVQGDGEICVHQAGDTLREASVYAQRHIYPPKRQMMPAPFFDAPQFNTWIELIYLQNQEGILQYARDIVAHGYPAGVLMIDDSWQRAHGIWEFRRDRFPDPMAMMDELHALGFKVMLWVSPFVSPDTPECLKMRREKLLVRVNEKTPAVIPWWNGFSCVLDLSNPAADAWLMEQLTSLMERYGVDGFKFDAGAPFYYLDEYVYYEPGCSGVKQTQRFTELAARFAYNELRETLNQPHLPCAQRLRDKAPAWQGNGLDTLIPNSLAQSLVGYPFICPDMIGGGEYSHFQSGDLSFLDEEMVVRAAQASAMLPMMQYSVAPWRILSKENAQRCLEAALTHQRFAPYILETLEDCLRTGEAVIRPLEYMWPHQGYERINTQFMLGEKYLVAPVLEKGLTRMAVTLPAGRWIADDGQRYEGGQTVEVATPLDRLVWFERLA